MPDDRAAGAADSSRANPTPLPGGKTWRSRASKLTDRTPTPWLITGLTTVLLGFSAVFGGLNDAPVQAAPIMEPGDTYEGTELTITVSQALLIDAFPEQNLTPDEGNRLLVVRAVVENTTTAPLRLSPVEADSIRVVGVSGLVAADPPTNILVIDDGSDEVVVQPGVPVEVAYIWEVDEDAVAQGDGIEVQLLDRVLISEGRLTYGGVYDDPVVSATVELDLDDVGAGVSE